MYKAYEIRGGAIVIDENKHEWRVGGTSRFLAKSKEVALEQWINRLLQSFYVYDFVYFTLNSFEEFELKLINHEPHNYDRGPASDCVDCQIDQAR